MSLPHAYSEKWQPYRDSEGKIVTLTWEQVNAVIHAVRVVDEVRRTQKRPAPGGDGGAIEYCPLYQDIPEKSRALGRLLLDGKPLFEEIPPYDFGAADYYLWDRENLT